MYMILHNLKVAVRNLLKYKLQTAISVVSIAIGIVTLAFTHTLISRYSLPTIYYEPYYDQTYQLEFISNNDGESVSINNDIIRALKKDGGPQCIDMMFIPNGSQRIIHAEFHLADSTIRKGKVFGLQLDPEYANYSGMRSAISGQKIKILKAGEAIVGEDFTKKVFQGKNPIGAVQTSICKEQPIPVTIVDVFKPVSSSDSPIGNYTMYYCVNNDIVDYDYDQLCYAICINAVLKKGCTKTQLEKEINDRVKPLDLKVDIHSIGESAEIHMIIGIQMIGYIIGALILLTAIIGFLRIELQLLRIRSRELTLRIVNGAKRKGVFGLLFTEIFVSISLGIIISLILGSLLQDFCNRNLNIFIINTNITTNSLWKYCLIIGAGLLAICGLIAWLAVVRIGSPVNALAVNMRGSRSHLFRNVMLCIQTMICIVFVCCTFIVVKVGDRILDMCHIPENGRQYKEYLQFYPNDNSNKENLIYKIMHLPDLEEAIVCSNSTYVTAFELLSNEEAKEKLNGRIYFRTYFTDDTTLVSKLGMDVEWFNQKIDRERCLLVSEKVYRRFQDLGIINNNSLTIMSGKNAQTLPIAGIIKNIPYDMEGESLMTIIPEWKNDADAYLLIPKPGKGASLARSINETIEQIEPELIDNIVANYRERMSYLPGLVEAARGAGWILGCVSLLICAMSIFSTIALDTRARRKEIAVRKVNGAKSIDIYKMFGRVYVVIIAISLFIAVPLCVLFNKVIGSFISDIALDCTISPILPIILGASVVILLIFTIVGWQTYKTMQVDPAKIIAKE